MHIVLVPTPPAIATLGAPAWTALIENCLSVSGVGESTLAALDDLNQAVDGYGAMAIQYNWPPLPTSDGIRRITTLSSPPTRESLARLLGPQLRAGMASSVTAA